MIGTLILSSWLLAAASTSDAEPSDWLRYGERPLSAEDFLAPVPEKRPVEDPRAEAYSETLVRYEYKFRTIRRAGKVRVEVIEISFYAVFDRQKSWNALPHDAELLEHHNGHFDIAQIEALKMQVEWNKRLKTEKLFGTGKTQTDALDDLEKKIGEEMRALDATLKREHLYFDDTTRYGTDADIKARERQRQRDRLKELQEQISGDE